MGSHTESIEIEYDPDKMDYSKLLKFFWKNHNPCTRASPQYMSVIFYYDEDQKSLAEKTLKEEQKKRNLPITTKIVPAEKFYDAEFYHQKYVLQKHPWICNYLRFDDDNDLITSHVACRLNGYLAQSGSVSDFEKEWTNWEVPEKVAEYVRHCMTTQSKFLC